MIPIKKFFWNQINSRKPILNSTAAATKCIKKIDSLGNLEMMIRIGNPRSFSQCSRKHSPSNIWWGLYATERFEVAEHDAEWLSSVNAHMTEMNTIESIGYRGW